MLYNDNYFIVTIILCTITSFLMYSYSYSFWTRYYIDLLVCTVVETLNFLYSLNFGHITLSWGGFLYYFFGSLYLCVCTH